jgi:hypothetical protein
VLLISRLTRFCAEIYLKIYFLGSLHDYYQRFVNENIFIIFLFKILCVVNQPITRFCAEIYLKIYFLGSLHDYYQRFANENIFIIFLFQNIMCC